MKTRKLNKRQRAKLEQFMLQRSVRATMLAQVHGMKSLEGFTLANGKPVSMEEEQNG